MPAVLQMSLEAMRGLQVLHEAPGGPIIHNAMRPEQLLVYGNGELFFFSSRLCPEFTGVNDNIFYLRVELADFSAIFCPGLGFFCLFPRVTLVCWRLMQALRDSAIHQCRLLHALKGAPRQQLRGERVPFLEASPPRRSREARILNILFGSCSLSSLACGWVTRQVLGVIPPWARSPHHVQHALTGPRTCFRSIAASTRYPRVNHRPPSVFSRRCRVSHAHISRSLPLPGCATSQLPCCLLGTECLLGFLCSVRS